MPTLSATGNTPLAYKLLLNETFPSWGFSIKHGATTTWERWDGWTPEKGFQDYRMNSFAHYSFGAVARWMFQTVAGIDTAEPGFQRLLIRPQPAEGLTWVKAGYHSIHGPIATEWRTEDGKLTLDSRDSRQHDGHGLSSGGRCGGGDRGRAARRGGRGRESPSRRRRPVAVRDRRRRVFNSPCLTT